MAASATSMGLITTFARIGYDAGGNALAQILIRSSVYLVVLVVALHLLRRPLRLPPGRRFSLAWLTAGLAGVSLGYLGSVSFIPVSLAALIVFTSPLLTAVIAALSGRGRLEPATAVALLVAFAGVGLTIGPELDSLDPRGLSLAALAAVSIAVMTVFGPGVVRTTDPLALNAWMNVGTIAIAALVAAVTVAPALPDTTGGRAGALAAALCYSLGMTLWFGAQQRLAPVLIGLVSNVEPVVTLAAAAIVLGERLSGAQLAGAAAILASVGLVTAAEVRARG